MKNKIVKSILAVVLTCSIGLSFGGCFNSDVGDNLEEYFDSFFGGLFGDDEPDDDKPAKPDKDSSDSSASEDTSSSKPENNFSKFPFPDSLYDHNMLPDETDQLSLVTQIYEYDDCTVTLSPIQAVIQIGDAFDVLLSCDKVQDLDYEVEIWAGATRGSVDGTQVTGIAKGHFIIQITTDQLPHEYYYCYVYVVGDGSEGDSDSSTGDTSGGSSSDDSSDSSIDTPENIVDVEDAEIGNKEIYF